MIQCYRGNVKKNIYSKLFSLPEISFFFLEIIFLINELTFEVVLKFQVYLILLLLVIAISFCWWIHSKRRNRITEVRSWLRTPLCAHKPSDEGEFWSRPSLSYCHVTWSLSPMNGLSHHTCGCVVNSPNNHTCVCFFFMQEGFFLKWKTCTIYLKILWYSWNQHD